MNLIFDLGANEGGNLKYYLSKASKVVAVEANPKLCNIIKSNFKDEIDSGKLILVENCLTINYENKPVTFYTNKYETGLGRFTIPDNNLMDYEEIIVKSISYKSLIDQFGHPDFVKIDLEGYDKIILNYLIEKELLPKYLQFENQGLDYLKKIISLGIYKSFNIVSFYNFSKIYNATKLRTAGPFGLDVKSPWISKSKILKLYQSLPHSWIDIHLSNENLIYKDEIDFKFYKYRPSVLTLIKRSIPSKFKSNIKALINYRNN
ncbi:methyltransferase, FkbM family [Psychroflexus salarius]|uniref:Methyltransferase, FkbM family n=1 Tax=Psychroflexus salarius TaxID=1155689 RepID=A0A1M4V5T3_9FLAO|nr:FkbM family methyltransferase [Psychroflexus salarius]SHE64305.1 methyltransferase, FkbM family [Psychroflexus salarius]